MTGLQVPLYPSLQAAYYHRAVAPSPAGPAMAGPVLSSETRFLKIKAKHFKTVSDLGGGALTKVCNALLPDWSPYRARVAEFCLVIK